MSYGCQIGANPTKDEIQTIEMLENYFAHPIIFCKPSNISKSADLLIGGQSWEIKTPKGNGKETLLHQLLRATKQSKRIIINPNYTAIPNQKVKNDLLHLVKDFPSIKELLLVISKEEIIKIR